MNNSAEILLVEDNSNDIELALYAFKKNKIGNSVHVVRDGAEALDYLFCKGVYSERQIEDQPKLILLDLKLPFVGGMEVLQQVKGDPRTQSIPVVVLTSSREDPDIAKCYKQGVNSYIVKPVDFEQFSKAVKHLGLYWLLLNQQGSPSGPGQSQ
jgi:two-component system, response regulator